jgi:hypothetical protein
MIQPRYWPAITLPKYLPRPAVVHLNLVSSLALALGGIVELLYDCTQFGFESVTDLLGPVFPPQTRSKLRAKTSQKDAYSNTNQ